MYSDYNKKYNSEHSAERVEYIRQWRIKNAEHVRNYARQYAKSYRKKHNERLRVKWRERYAAKEHLSAKKRHADRRSVVFAHYGKLCVCCGVKDDVFLTIDHINGKQGERITGMKLYKSLIDRGFPSGYQTLCFNCNFAKYRGICPHKTSV